MQVRALVPEVDPKATRQHDYQHKQPDTMSSGPHGGIVGVAIANISRLPEAVSLQGMVNTIPNDMALRFLPFTHDKATLSRFTHRDRSM